MAEERKLNEDTPPKNDPERLLNSDEPQSEEAAGKSEKKKPAASQPVQPMTSKTMPTG
jgi:hypothetical protein